MLALWRFFYIVINEFIFYVEFFICYHMCLKFSFYFILLLYLELIFFWVFGLISIFFFWETKMGAFIVMLHPRALSQYRDQLDEAQPSTMWGGQPLLSMPTNGLLRAARIEPRCGTRNERTLPTQPSPCWPG